MRNAWVEFVRQYAKDNNLSYGCAISEASPAYRKMKAMNVRPEDKKKSKITISKNVNRKEDETLKEQIRKAEYELQDIINNTLEVYFVSSIKPALTGRKGMNPAHRRDILIY